MLARLTLLFVAGTLIIPTLRAQTPKQPRMDSLGDRLPDGALARLGTLRYKHAPSGDPTIDVASFSPDGKRIASLVYGRGSVHICDAATGKEIPGAWKSNHGCTAFAFSPDGSTLAMTTNQNQIPQKMVKGKEVAKQEVISLFDIVSGKLAKALTGQPENIRALVFADGGKTLVSAGMGTVRWWDVASGKELRSWQPLAEDKELAAGETKKTKTFFNCVLAPDAKAIALHAFYVDGNNPGLQNVAGNAAGDQEAVGISLETRKTVWRLVQKRKPNENQNQNTQQSNMHMRFAFSADGKCVAIAMGTDKVELRDTHNGKLLTTPLVGGAGFPGGLALSADGAMVAVAGNNSHVTIWQADGTAKPRIYKSRKLVARIAQFWGNSTHGLDFSADGKKLLVGVDADLQIYDVATLQEIHPADGHRGWIDYVAFAADGKRLLTGCADMNLRSQELAAWDTATWKRLQLTSERMPPWPNFGIASPDQAVYVGNAGSDRSGLFDLKTGKLLSRINVPGKQGDQGRGFFSPGGNFYMLADQDAKGKAIERLYEVRSGKLRAELPPLVMVQQSMESARPIALSFDERLVALFSQNDGVIHVFDTLTGKPLQRLGGGVDVANGPRGAFAASLAFARDGKMLASWNVRDSVIRLWDVATAKELLQVTHAETGPNQGGPNQGRVHFAWSADCRLLAVGQNKIQLLELATLGVRREWAGHQDGAVRALAISPDGRLLASGSSDTTVLIWDMACADDGAGSQGPLAHDDLAKHWQALALNDAASAFAAIRTLASSPKETVAWIGEQLKPVGPHDVKHVDDLIGRLDDNRYVVRQKATAELLKIGERVVPALDNILAGNPTLEARLRLQDLRKRMTGLVLNGQRLQGYRAVEVLERIGTPQARQLLQAFAGGAAGATLTVQARAAIERLK